MKKHEIKVGGRYHMKVSGVVTTVRVDAIREIDAYAGRGKTRTVYDCTNLATGRSCRAESAQKFRGGVNDAPARKPLIAEPINADGAPLHPTSPASGSAPSAASAKPDEPGTWFASQPAQLEEEPTVPFASQPNPSATSTSESSSSSISEAEAELASPGHAAVIAAVKSLLEPMAFEEHHEPCCKFDGLKFGLDYCNCSCHRPTSKADQRFTVRNGFAAATQRMAADSADGKVAGYKPTDEQRAVLEAAKQSGLKALVIAAGAGAGKTSTLKMLEATLAGNGQYTAFNKALVEESRSKFSRCAVNTTHSLAFRAVGYRYSHRLNSNRMRSEEVARRLGVADFEVTMVPAVLDAEGKVVEPPKIKRLVAGYLAGQVMQAIKRFCQSADREITVKHFKYIDGIDTNADGKRGYANNDRVKEYLLPFAEQAWQDANDVDGQLPYQPDYYVKSWQLGQGKDRPVIAADYLLLDEAQDSAEVFLDIIRQQTHALLVLVGDENQSIYGWRGAVDAMKAFPGAPRRMLSQSFRFGQAIADVANAVLGTLDEPTDLVMRGLESIPSRVAPLDKPRCILTRTNAAAVGAVLRHHQDGGKPHLIGGGAETVKWVRAAKDLQDGRRTQHPELACFESWVEVQEYSKTDEGEELRLMTKLVDEFKADAILSALEKMPREEEADLVVSTAHKSKGREWDTVQLGGDFKTANKLDDAERRLVYVAATRAKHQLDISKCPTFCGGYDKRHGEGGLEERFIPGIEIEHTQPMPTAEQLDMYLASKGQTQAELKVEHHHRNGTVGIESPAPAPEQPVANGSKPEYTWAKHDGMWCVRGPADSEGKTVRVVRRDGTSQNKRLGTAAQKYPEAWLYRVL